MKSLLFLFFFILSSRSGRAVEYFAYFGDGMRGVGNGNYISQTSDFSNLHFISSPFENGVSDEWRSKVLQASQKNNKSILMLEGFVFQWRSLQLNDYHHQLLGALKSKLSGLENNIFGIYLIDEPYYKNSLNSNPLSRQQVRDNLRAAAKIIKQYFPQAKIIMTEAYPQVDSSLEIPNEIDWVGVNCYLAFGDVCSLDKIKNYTKTMARKLNSQQRLVFTLDGFWPDSSATSITTQEKIILRNNELLKLAKEFNAIAFFPFLYQTDLTGEQLYGADSMPKVLNYLNEIGQSIRNGTYSDAGECVRLEPKCEGKDYVRRDSCGKEIERWKNAPAPYCTSEIVTPPPTPSPAPTCVVVEPKCEGKDFVRRDSCGKEIERWKNAPAPYCTSEIVTPPPTPSPSPACVVVEPKCEGKDFVRRDSCGKEIERWKNAPAPYCPGR